MDQEITLVFEKDDSGKIAKVEVFVPLFEKEQDGYYFVQCPVFKTIGSSNVSFEEAYKDHEIDINIFFKAHLERDTLISTLNSLGWKKTTNNHYTPQIPSYLLDRANAGNIKQFAV